MSVHTVGDVKLNPMAIRQDLNLSRERMGRILHVSAKTLERWENRNEILNPKARKNFAKLREIAALARAVYTPEGVEAFLTTPPGGIGRAHGFGVTEPRRIRQKSGRGACR